MRRRLTVLLLMFALAGTFATGAALPHEEHACPMQGMDGAMDCCALAELQSAAPEVAAARLCCALDCPQPAPLSQNVTAPRAPQSAQAAHPAHAPVQSPLPAPVARGVPVKFPAANSPPAYLQHAAFLI